MTRRRDLAILAGALLILVVGLGALYASRSQSPTDVSRPAGPTAPGVPAPTITTVPSLPSSSPAPAAGTFENRILGYRITLPATYQLVNTSINAGQPEQLGSESYRTTTVAEARADCVSETGGGIASIIKGEPIDVSVLANVRGLPVVQWASSSAWGRLHTVEAVSVGGYEAARLVQQGVANTYVISANDRMYVLSHLNAPSSQRLADIAATFRALPPAPFPTAPPGNVARDAASDLGRRLAQAFVAKDASAVAGLMIDCRIYASADIAGRPLGSEGISRSSAAFITALRDRFAKGDLTVTVNPDVQVEAVSGQFFVRSEWKEPDRTIPIDLFFRELGGRWQGTLATHHYPGLVGNNCIPYRSPWTASSCE